MIFRTGRVYKANHCQFIASDYSFGSRGKFFDRAENRVSSRAFREVGERPSSLAGLGDNLQLLQLVYNQLNYCADDFVRGTGVKAVAGSRPDEYAARRGDGVDVALNL